MPSNIPKRLTAVKRNLSGMDDTMELLAKAVGPDDMKAIASASSKEGPDLIDHKAHIDSLSEGPLAEHVEKYKKAMDHPDMKPEKFHGFADGISPKQIFSHKKSKYIVKPYFETPDDCVRAFAKFPICGWAELANQALYHAVGLGDFHQKVTAAEHPAYSFRSSANGPASDGTVPAIVIHAADGHTTFKERGDFALKGNTDAMFSDVMRKINVLDFLTNNLDRHVENMLSSDMGYGLAIDHGLSFQYTSNMSDKWQNNKTGKDTFGAYVNRKAGAAEALLGVGDALPRPLKASPYVQVIKWWGANSDKARMAMKEQLKFIKNTALRKHIWTNFKARADVLDSWAEFGLENFGAGPGGSADWLRQIVPIHPHPDYKHMYAKGV